MSKAPHRKQRNFARIGNQHVLRVEHPATFTDQPLPDSTHLLQCPKCGAKRYVDERFVKSIEDAKQATGIVSGAPMHRPCNTLMTIEEVKNRQ